MVAAAPRQINPIDAVAQSRAVRHFGKLVGLAGAIAIGMVVVLWSAEPNFAPLYDNMSGKDAAQAADALMSRDIEFRLDAATGTLMVDQGRISEARLLLASQGLAGGSAAGMEMLQEEQGIGTSQFIEAARYNHALEAELVRSVESIQAVETARVHLAIPEQSIFIRNRTKPSASVIVKLYPGRTLNQGQVEAIVQMIASSIAMLESSEVKVVDQFGRLLTDDEDAGMAQTTRQFDYTRKLEDSFVDRIINLLQPIVGQGKVNAQVAAQLDFSTVESTREAYDPERSVIRSEQISEEENRSLSQALGIPGALSNQPPASGEIEGAAGAEAGADNAAQVLSYLPESSRAGILMRIATLEGVQPAAIKELDSIMERYFSDSENVKSSMVGGEKTAADILNLIDGEIENKMMEQVRSENEELAQRIEDQMFVFENLRAVDDRGIQTMMREVSTDLLALALKGVDDEMQKKFLKNMSSRAAEMLVEDMEAKGPVKLSEVETAQKEILAVARKLEESGEIVLGGGGEEMV